MNLHDEIARLRMQVDYEQADARDLRVKLASERAAREQAEKDARHYAERAEAWELGCNEAKSYWQQAEADCATQKALLAATEQQLEIKAALLESERAAREHAQRAVRDTALERVKELEPWEKRYDKLNGQYEWQAEQLVKEYDRRVAAETALASARPVLYAVAEYIRALRSDDPKDDDANAGALEVAYDAWLTSHPATVAAPCAGCASARELLQNYVDRVPASHYDHRPALAWLKEHPCADTRCPVFGCGIRASDGLPCPFDGHAQPDDCKVKP